MLEFLLGISMVLLGAMLVIMVATRIARGRTAVSMLNIFTLGLLIFQVSSAGIAFFTRNYGEVPPGDPKTSGMIYVGLLYAFVLCLYVIYARRWFTFRIPNLLSTRFPSPASTSLLVLAAGCLGMAAVFRFVLMYVPMLGILSNMIGCALASLAAGCACWAWSRNAKNPLFIAGMLAVVGGAFLLTIYQNFGRRDASSVMIACLWGAFHGNFKRIDWKRAALPLVAVGGVALVAIAALTSTRSEKVAEMSIGEVLRRMLSADIAYGLIDMASGQEAGPISMWLIESRPSPTPYDTLHTAYYASTMAFPRTIWEETLGGSKPSALGLTMVPEAGITRKSVGYNVGPGLIGHVWNDNPLIAFPLYAIFIGAMLRVFDDLVEKQPDNPFAVLPVGVVCAEIVAMPRGELGLFLFRTMVGVTSAMIAMRLIAALFKMMGSPMKDEEGRVLSTRLNTGGEAAGDWDNADHEHAHQYDAELVEEQRAIEYSDHL